MMCRFRRADRGHSVNIRRNFAILGRFPRYGMESVMTVGGATDAAVFRTYVSRVTVPTLRPGDAVAMDNLCTHEVACTENASNQAVAIVVYLHPTRQAGHRSNLVGQRLGTNRAGSRLACGRQGIGQNSARG